MTSVAMLKQHRILFSRIFVLERPDGRAVVAFEARSSLEAQQLRKEIWFCEELKSHRHVDVRTLRARPASAEETSAYQTALAAAPPNKDEELYLAYLAG